VYPNPAGQPGSMPPPSMWAAPARKAPSGWWYAIGAAFLVVGILSLALMFRDLLAFPAHATRVLAPGEGRVALNPGSYAVAYEYESVLGGEVIRAPVEGTGLQVTVVAADTQEPVPVRVPSGEFTYQSGSYAGRLIARFTVDRPGAYLIRSGYAADGDGPRAVLAVGPDGRLRFGLEIAGLVVGLLAGVVILLITIIRQVRAHQPRR